MVDDGRTTDGPWLYYKLTNEPEGSGELKMACAPSQDSDQPGHLPSLIRVFAVRMKKHWVLSYPLSSQRRLWSDWADAQADLSLCWAHSHFVGFVVRRSRLLLHRYIWALAQQNHQYRLDASEESDLPGHPPSLISLCCVHIILLVLLCCGSHGELIFQVTCSCLTICPLAKVKKQTHKKLSRFTVYKLRNGVVGISILAIILLSWKLKCIKIDSDYIGIYTHIHN